MRLSTTTLPNALGILDFRLKSNPKLQIQNPKLNCPMPQCPIPVIYAFCYEMIVKKNKICMILEGF